MKTAISIDTMLFFEAESFSDFKGISRSRLYCNAVREYIQNHSPNIITEKLNKYFENHESAIDDDLKEAAYELFEKEGW